MREILFRGKEITSGEWICGYYNGRHIVQWHDNEIETFSGAKTTKTQTMIEVIPETVGQYTGLTDMNGKRIFEGDILESFINGEDETKVKVVWHNAGFCTQRDDLEPEPIEEYEDWWSVIGNAHDSPELLEVEAK